MGRGKRAVTAAIQWLRGGDEKLAIVTNGRQWRLVMAGLDYEAFCEWDIDRWLESGQPSDELFGLRALLHPSIWTPPSDDEKSPLVEAIADSRKGQADLSAVLGERVRQAVEVLIQAHGPLLDTLQQESNTPPTNAEIYRAGVRLVMRLVVGLFAESREGLLPKDNPIFHQCYSLSGLRDQLERISPARRASSYSAYPRVVSLFRLIHDGSSHEALSVPSYGGSLFAPGDAESSDGVSRALHVFEQGGYERDLISDEKIFEVLNLLSRTKVKIRQGRGFIRPLSPVDFSSLDSEYIGILYEGLLDFELHVAGDDGPVIFLAVGNQPALPLSTLEAMDDKAFKNLLEKMKDTSSGEDDEAESDEEPLDEEADNTEGESQDEDEDEDDDDEGFSGETDDETDDDIRHTARTAAETWARRAIAVGKLVPKPRGKMTPEKQLAFDAAVDRKARQIITKVVLPGERYLVRWGGTRKGSGTFYTRPQLAIPTVHRTLRPLAYEPTEQGESNANDSLDQDTSTQTPDTPRRPEEILALKVCDPACGSGSFPLAALRFLTDALYHSLVHHDRFKGYDDRTVIDLIRDTDNETTLADETLPCRPDDAEFEPRTKAVLRRYIVERCIYGVDLDPLAVELCRLSLWIETLDRRLPFTFLDHKIKCGNSLVGTWFDQFMHYPAMAWLREGGDKNHTTGVHFKKEAWTKAISKKVKDVKKDLIDYIDGAKLIYKVDLSTIETIHAEAEKALEDIHLLGIHETEQRAQKYVELRESESFKEMQFAFDLYCSLWFWPPDQIDTCPLPLDFYAGDFDATVRDTVAKLAERHRFFHWEVEFPDVFNQANLGFDAVLGNPPWETLQPNSKEHFSAIDPLYRSYGNQEAKSHHKEYFQDKDVERDWLQFCGFYKEIANWMKYSGSPFGNKLKTGSGDKQEHQFPIGDRGRGSYESSEARHIKWAQKREETSGYADTEHAFQYQGGGKPYTHKMFLETSHALLREGGRLGLVVPSGLYSDHGTRELRELFIEHCDWEWLFGFENREGIFDIHRSFKFNPIVIQKGGRTTSIQTAFMRRKIEDWENADSYVTNYPRDRVLQFSPRSKAILEIQSQRDLQVLEKIYSGSVLLGDDGPDGWGIKYAQGDFNMTSDSKLFPPRTWWEERGYIPDEYSRWVKGNWQPRTASCPAPPDCKRTDIPPGIILSRDGEQFLHEDDIDIEEFVQANGKPIIFKFEDDEGEKEDVQPIGPAIALPIYEGRMIGHYEFSKKGWISGKGRGAVWRDIEPVERVIEPQFLLGGRVYELAKRQTADHLFKVGMMDVTSATNSRTMINTVLGRVPTIHKVPTLAPNATGDKTFDVLVLSAMCSSFSFDHLIRNRLGGQSLVWAALAETAFVKPSKPPKAIADLAMSLVGAQPLASRHVCGWQFRNGRTVRFAFTAHERTRVRCIIEALVAWSYGVDENAFGWLMRDCDHPIAYLSRNSRLLDPKGFWRIDKTKTPELRFSILSQIAFRDLMQCIVDANDEILGINEFINQNDGEGWQLPETLRLADYGLGHDDRAKEHQPVRECFGPRFYDWQLTQTPEESWAECHLHARNLLGEAAYERLVSGDSGLVVGEEPAAYQSSPSPSHQPEPDEPFQLTGEPKTTKRRKR
ncbi:Eco57I restriction-modification methylase domain-containing protein [Crateriforma spongiae]|uniref:Eco57I restriction-modification methylase domain-containing protein n=1 Tax=Crateriforma spongiae TaxID=2724528 RepID=UPI0014477264|nr:hypothetical protein [Crateriforma spongiae]